jgi:hypothetical protein
MMSTVDEPDEQALPFWSALRRDALRNPRGIGLALFAVGVLSYGFVASNRQAVTIALILCATVIAVLVVPAAVVSRRARRGKHDSR